VPHAKSDVFLLHSPLFQRKGRKESFTVAPLEATYKMPDRAKEKRRESELSPSTWHCRVEEREKTPYSYSARPSRRQGNTLFSYSARPSRREGDNPLLLLGTVVQRRREPSFLSYLVRPSRKQER